MNGNVHVWLVEDALRFVKAKGKPREKQAFQAWESAYGGGDIDTTPSYATRIVDVIGMESKYTDYYHDLAMYLESWAGAWQDDITEYDGHIFTALDHFLSVPWWPTCWWRTNGYHYFWSSRAGNDAKAMTGKVDYKDAEVDNDHSPVVPRCRFGWTASNSAWSDNWEADIRYTVFIPVSVLAYYYYYRLVYRYFNYVDVDGERYDSIRGMHLLGPVCHAVADACVPQHAISAMDYKHQEWENVVETWAKYYQLEDFDLVRNLLDTHMGHPIYTGGTLKDMLGIDYLVSEMCGWRTYVQFLSQNGLGDIDDMKSQAFWANYMANLNKVKADARYFYNLAIAATVRVITEACYDVIATGGGTHSTPTLRGVTGYQLVGGVPRRMQPGVEMPDLPLSPELHYVRASNLLAYRPVDWRTPTSTLHTTRETLYRWSRENQSHEVAARQLASLEDELLLQFKLARQAGLTRFEPARTLEFPAQTARLREACGLSPVSNDQETHPVFGLATFRPPTAEEAEDADKFREYLEDCDANVVNSKLIGLTRCIALHRFLTEEATNRVQRRKLAQVIAGLERLRQSILTTRRLPGEQWEASEVPLQKVEIAAARPEEGVVLAPD